MTINLPNSWLPLCSGVFFPSTQVAAQAVWEVVKCVIARKVVKCVVTRAVLQQYCLDFGLEQQNHYHIMLARDTRTPQSNLPSRRCWSPRQSGGGLPSQCGCQSGSCRAYPAATAIDRQGERHGRAGGEQGWARGMGVRVVSRDGRGGMGVRLVAGVV